MLLKTPQVCPSSFWVNFNHIQKIESKQGVAALFQVWALFHDYGITLQLSVSLAKSVAFLEAVVVLLNTYFYTWHRFDPCVNGGESILLDTYPVLEELRQKHPEHFATLARVPATFQKVHYERYILWFREGTRYQKGKLNYSFWKFLVCLFCLCELLNVNYFLQH